MLKYTLQQTEPDTCGRLVLNVALAFVHHHPGYLFLNASLPKKSSFWDLVEAGKAHGLILKPQRYYHFPTFQKLRKPLIALIQPESPHYVLVRPKRHHVTIYDPYTGESRMSYHAFWAIFTQYSLVIDAIVPTASPPRMPQTPFLSWPLFALWASVSWLFAIFFWWIDPWKGQTLWIILFFSVQLLFLLYHGYAYLHFQRRGWQAYHTLLTNENQFKRWLWLLQYQASLPLKKYSHGVIQGIIVIYLASLSWFLVLIYIGVGSLFIFLEFVTQPRFQKANQRLSEIEKKISYPLSQTMFIQLQRHAIRIVLAHGMYWIGLIGLILGALNGYHALAPFSHFSSWITGLSVFFTFFHVRRDFHAYRENQTRYFTTLDQFLNPK